MVLSQSVPNGCCPQCGAALIAGQPKCWLCHAESPAGADVESVAWVLQPRVEHPSAAPAGHLQYSLSSLLLFMTIVAVLVGIIAMHQGIGIVVAIVALPLLAHACFATARRKARVQSPSSGGGVGKERVQSSSAGSTLAAALLTLAMVVTVPVAAGVAFFFACAASLVSSPGGRDPLMAGGMAALVVGGAATCLFVGLLVAVIRKP
jgi:hypothetical protein